MMKIASVETRKGGVEVLRAIMVFGFTFLWLAAVPCLADGAPVTVSFLNPTGKPATLKANLHLPPGNGPFPAVVLIHGSAGPDTRYAFHRPALLAAGIATFEVDFKTGVFSDTKDRPGGKAFYPMTFAALKALRARPEIDGEKIAVMGFSLGGSQAVATSGYGLVQLNMGPAEKGFAAHVGFYPGCGRLGWLMRQKPTSPVLILTGENDDYGNGRDCPPLVARLNERTPGLYQVHVYPGVHHGFDREGETVTVPDPVADGGQAKMEWSQAAAEDSRARAVSFLKEAMGLPNP